MFLHTLAAVVVPPGHLVLEADRVVARYSPAAAVIFVVAGIAKNLHVKRSFWKMLIEMMIIETTMIVLFVLVILPVNIC